MYDPIYTKGTDVPAQTFFYNDVKIKKNENDRSPVINKSSTDDKKEKLRAAKGIIYALIFCIPFWLLFMKIAFWLF